MQKRLFDFPRLGRLGGMIAACLIFAMPAPHSRATEVLGIGHGVQMSPVPTNAIAVSIFEYSFAVLRADGTVDQWRNGATSPGVSNIVAFATGWSHGFGFRADGSLVGWGSDIQGGISGKPANLTNAVAVAIGSYNTLAVREDGSVFGWGRRDYGLLDVPPVLSNAVAVSVGTFGANAIALKADGTVLGWGSGITNTHPGISNAIAVVTLGPNYGAALHYNGTVTVWPPNPPFDPPPANLTNIVAIAAGGSHMLALRADGTVAAWGCDCGGATTLPTGLTNVTSFAAGGGDGIDFSIFLIDHTNPTPALEIVRSTTSVHLTLTGQRFRRYVVEEADSVDVDGNWKFRRNVTLSATGKAVMELPVTGNAGFYRARLMP